MVQSGNVEGQDFQQRCGTQRDQRGRTLEPGERFSERQPARARSEARNEQRNEHTKAGRRGQPDAECDAEQQVERVTHSRVLGRRTRAANDPLEEQAVGDL